MRGVTERDLLLARKLAWKLTRSTTEQEEATGDAYEGVAEAAASFDPNGTVSWGAWLYRTVFRAVIAGHRERNGRRLGAPESSRVYATADESPHFTRPLVNLWARTPDDVGTWAPSPEDSVMEEAERQAVRDAVAKLSPYDQAVAWASVTQGQRSLAEERGVTESAVCHQRRKVHARLKRLLERAA